MEIILAKGTALGNMEFLPQSDKDEFIRITDAIYEWEAAYHPLPGKTKRCPVYTYTCRFVRNAVCTAISIPTPTHATSRLIWKP